MPDPSQTSAQSVVDDATFNNFISDFRGALQDTKGAVWRKAEEWGGSTPCDVFGVSIDPGGTVDALQNNSCANVGFADRMLIEFDEIFVPLARQALLCPPGQACDREKFARESTGYLDAVMDIARRLNKWADTSYLTVLLESFYRVFLDMLDKVIDVAIEVGERIAKRVVSNVWLALGLGVVVAYFWTKRV